MNQELRDRLLSRVIVDPENFCWMWTGSTAGHGYGKIYLGNNQTAYAHRLAYQEWTGPIPDGQEIDHLCRNTLCCNPLHLEAVTHRVNMLRGKTVAARNASKTHCAQGHPYSTENTYCYRNHRVCRTCQRGWRVKRRGAADRA